MAKLAQKKDGKGRAPLQRASAGTRKKKPSSESVHDELRELMRHAYMQRMNTPSDHPHT